ncbi:MAG: hypothetical protein V4692_09190 [Bdellovibrionota bacterium]
MALEQTAVGEENWLLLTDYASKYRISVSTLRRRIKAHQVQFRFEGGKYLLLDEAPEVHEPESPESGPASFAAQAAPMKDEGKLNHLHQASEFSSAIESSPNESVGGEPIISTATRLLNELKRAYMNILQEKEEQLIQVKEEVSDLKTLVRVLESDNDRMRRILQAWDKE